MGHAAAGAFISSSSGGVDDACAGFFRRSAALGLMAFIRVMMMQRASTGRHFGMIREDILYATPPAFRDCRRLILYSLLAFSLALFPAVVVVAPRRGADDAHARH